MTNYRDLTKTEAAAALREFLDERGPALDRLRERLVADGQDPAALLDGTPESLVPLWRWLLSRLTSLDTSGATDPAAVPRESWPSWERYTTEKQPTLSLESLILLDGLVSYLAAVVRKRAPLARWEIARDRHKRYQFNKPSPGQRHGRDPQFPAGPPLDKRRRFPPRSPGVAGRRDGLYARELIEHLNEGDRAAAGMEPEPPFEIEDVRDEPGGYDFEVGLGDEIAHERSADVDRFVRELSREEGIHEVFREDRELLLVRAPLWSIDALQGWLAQRI